MKFYRIITTPLLISRELVNINTRFMNIRDLTKAKAASFVEILHRAVYPFRMEGIKEDAYNASYYAHYTTVYIYIAGPR